MDAAGSDYSKSAIVPMAHRRLRQDVFRDTLAAIAQSEFMPGVVVIAGDVTFRDKPDGWTHLPSIMKPLYDGGLDPAHVVITPGNHDVTKNLVVDDPAHYERYLAGIDDHWVSPLLDGREIDE